MKRRLLVSLLFFGLFFCCFFFLLNPVLAGWEAHSPLFRYSANFMVRYHHDPYGALLCCNAFLIQFSYYPALGAAIYALLFCLLAWCINTFAAHPGDNGSKRPPLFLGFAIVWCLLPAFSFNFCTIWFIFVAIAGGGLVWKACRKNETLEICARAGVLLLLLLFIREYAIVAWLVYTVADFVWSESSPLKKTARALLYLVVLMAGSAGGIAWMRPYLFFDKMSVFSLFSPSCSDIFDRPFSCFLAPPLSIFPLWLGVALLCTCALWGKMETRASKRWIFPVCAGAISVFCVVAAPLSSRTLQTFLKADRLMREYKWSEATEVLEKDYSRRTRDPKKTHANVLYDTQLKCCLLAQRKATAQLFTYSLRSFPLLFPENLVNRVESYVLPVYYGYVGGFGESLHMNYDWVTSQTINPVVMNEIIRVSMILGDTLPASKFVYMMQESLFRGRETRRIFEGKDQTFNRMIERGKDLIPKQNYTVGAYLPDKSMLANFHFQENNLYDYEYFLTYLLLDKASFFFWEELENIRKFYPKRIPRHIQEAVLASFNYSPVRVSYPARIDGIDQEVWSDYWDFLLDERSYQTKNLDFDEFYTKWKHTYWFYNLYMVRKNG